MNMKAVEGVDWRKIIKQYQPEAGRSIWQMVNTLVPYVGLFALMLWMVNAGISYWWVLLLSYV